MQLYVLSYDPFGTRISPTQLFTFIRDSRKIAEWHSPFAGTYMLKSVEPVHSLLESFGAIFSGTPYILTPAHASGMTGALDPSIWTWLNNSPNALLGALSAAFPLNPQT